ncbi:MAG TPA: hypothetical protein DD435_09600 [Cyanobacteria bacterium UBA8530]|nr:hypothetical protein [Cyanobacteria bacterium UBA8530]
MQAGYNGGLSTFRIENLSDSIFSIVMTILILGIKVPSVHGKNVSALLLRELSSQWPNFFCYALSFVVLGIFWISHHNQFHYIKGSDRILLWLNIFFLMFVSLIPFSAQLFAGHPWAIFAIGVYGANLICASLLLYLHWCYAADHHRLVASDIDPELVLLAKRRILFPSLFYAAAILAAFFHPALSFLLYTLAPILFILPSRIDRHWEKTASA